LAFHHTYFKKRQINVELTAGGGGNKSDARKEKLKVKNDRLTEERVSTITVF
jgi:nucleolar protein 6